MSDIEMIEVTRVMHRHLSLKRAQMGVPYFNYPVPNLALMWDVRVFEFGPQHEEYCPELFIFNDIYGL
jgi:hypothetical protein